MKGYQGEFIMIINPLILDSVESCWYSVSNLSQDPHYVDLHTRHFGH